MQIAARPKHRIKVMERNEASVHARWKALQDICKNPECIDDDLIAACSSQGKLALLKIENIGIYPMVLNTLISTADRILDGGFKALDNLRGKALAIKKTAVEDKRKENIGKKTFLAEENARLKRKIQAYINSNVSIANKYNELLLLLRQIMEKAESGLYDEKKAKYLLSKHLHRFDDLTEREFIVVKGGKSD